YEVFGLSFSLDAPGGTAQTLFINGGLGADFPTGPAHLARLNPDTFEVTPIGNSSWGELAGNGSAELWAYFPDAMTSRVSRLDKATGKESKQYMLPSLNDGMQSFTMQSWGGDLFLFIQKGTEASTNVYRFH